MSVFAIYGALSEISKSGPHPTSQSTKSQSSGLILKSARHSKNRDSFRINTLTDKIHEIHLHYTIQYIESNNFDFKDCQIYRRFFVLYSQSVLAWVPRQMLMLLHVNKSFGQDGYRMQCTSELTPSDIVTYRAEKQIFRCFGAKSTEHLCCSKLESGNFRS